MFILFDLAGIALFFALVLSPLIRDLSNRYKLVDEPDGARKTHSEPVPPVGGIAIALAYLAALGFVFVAPYQYLPVDISRAWDAALDLLPAAGLVFLIGLLDDLFSLKPWQKLTGQVVAALLAYWSGFGVYVLRGEPLQDWVSLPVTVFWLVGCANALNLIDGMDGLAAGVGFFAAATMLVAALVHQNLAMAMVVAPLLGALLGFLRYNFNPASIFLGDSGSLLIGFLLGCYGALWTSKSATILGMTAPLIALALPLLDTSVAIARRFLARQPIFGADRGHIHHKLLDMGWNPRRVALVLYGLCGLAAALSLLHDVLDNELGGLIIVVFCAASWLGVQHLGYAEFGMASRLIVRGQLRGIIDIQLRMQHFERQLGASESIGEFWNRLVEGCSQFGFAGVRMRAHRRQFVSGGLDIGAKRLWQLRVPLNNKEYVNLFHDPANRMNPIILAHFTDSVERVFRERASAFSLNSALPIESGTGSEGSVDVHEVG